jgi:hypothetical protein
MHTWSIQPPRLAPHFVPTELGEIGAQRQVALNYHRIESCRETHLQDGPGTMARFPQPCIGCISSSIVGLWSSMLRHREKLPAVALPMQGTLCLSF